MNYFELFDLEPSVLLNLDDLKKRYYRLARTYHPDANRTSDAQTPVLDAQDMSSSVNEGYRVLSSLPKRIEHLLGLMDLGDKMSDAPDMDFLMEVMDLNEKIEQVKVNPRIASEVGAAIQSMQEEKVNALQELPESDPLSWDDQHKSALLKIYQSWKYLLRMQENMSSFAAP